MAIPAGYIVPGLSDIQFIREVLNDPDASPPWSQSKPYKDRMYINGIRGINDCLKDGTASKAPKIPTKDGDLQRILQELFHDNRRKPNYAGHIDQLKEYETPIFNACVKETIPVNKMTKILNPKSVTKAKPLDSYFPDEPTVTHDSGIDPLDTLTKAECVILSANSIDKGPGGHCRRIPYQFFPSEGTGLSLSKDVLGLFGFKNLSIRMVTTEAADRPNFKFMIEYSDPGRLQWRIEEEVNEKFKKVHQGTPDYFEGNPEKNTRILELLRSRNFIEIMKLFIGKEVGDVLQVILDTIYVKLRKMKLLAQKGNEKPDRKSISFTCDGVFAALRLDSGRRQENAYVALQGTTDKSRGLTLYSWKVLTEEDKNRNKFIIHKDLALSLCGELIYKLNYVLYRGEVFLSKEEYELGPEGTPRRNFFQDLLKQIEDAEAAIKGIEFNDATFKSDLLRIDSETPENIFSMKCKPGQIQFVNVPSLFPKGRGERYRPNLFTVVQGLSNKVSRRPREEAISARREARVAAPPAPPPAASRRRGQKRALSVSPSPSPARQSPSPARESPSPARQSPSPARQRSQSLPPIGGARPKSAKRARANHMFSRKLQKSRPFFARAVEPEAPEFYEEIKDNTILLPVYNALKCIELDDEQIEIFMTCLEPYFTHLERVIISEKFYEDLFRERLVETYTYYIDMTLTEFKDRAEKMFRDTREFEKQYYPFDKMEDPNETRFLVCDGDNVEEIEIPSCGVQGGGRRKRRKTRRSKRT